MAGLSTAGAPIVQVFHEKSRILPDVSRVLACLYEKDIKFETHTSSYKSLLKLQASTHAPVPFYDGPIFLEESREICRHIAEKYERVGYPFLLGKDALERASVEQWLHNEEHAFNPPSRALFCHLAFPPDKEDNGDAIDMHIRKLEEVLEVYEQRLSDSEFLAGNMFTLADLVHLPNSHYITASEKFVYLYDSRKNVRRWWDAISTRYSWQQVLMYMKSVEKRSKQEEKTTTYDASSDQLVKGPLHEHIRPTAPTHQATEPIHDRRTSKDPQLRGGSQAELAHAERESSLSDKKTARELFRQETKPSVPIIRGVPLSDSQSVTRKIQEVTPDYGHPGKPLVPRQDDEISHASQAVPRQEDMKYSQGTRDSQKSDILRPPANVHEVTRDEASEKQDSRMGSAFGLKESGATAPYRVKSPNGFGAEESHKKDITDEQNVVSPLWSKEPTSQVRPPSRPSQEIAPRGDFSSERSTLEQWQHASTQLKDMITTSGEQRVETPIQPIESEPSRVQSTSPSFSEATITDHAVIEDKFVKQSTTDERPGRSKQMQARVTHAPLASPTKIKKTPDGPEVADFKLLRSSEGQMLDAAKATSLGSATIRECSHDVAFGGNKTYDASSDQLVKGSLHEQTQPPAPTHEATEPIDDRPTSKGPQLHAGSQAEVAHTERKSPLSDKKQARTAQHLSPVEPFGQETRPSAPNIRGLPPSDSRSVTRKIQELPPDYGRPEKPLVPSQDDQISHASQAVPHQEDMKYTPDARDFQKLDIQHPLAKVHEVTRGEASEKQGSYVGSTIGPKESGARAPSTIEQWQHASTPLKDMTTSSGEQRVETPILPIEPEASHVQSTSPSFPQAGTTDLGVIDDRFVKQSTINERLGRSKQMQAPVTDSRLSSTTKRKTPYGPEVADLELVRSSEGQVLDAAKATPPGQRIVSEDSHDAAIDERTATYDAKSDQLIKKPLHETWPPAPTHEATEPVDDRQTSKDPQLHGSSQAEVAKLTLSDKKQAHAAQHFPPVELFRQETRPSSPVIKGVPASDSQSVTRKIQEVTPDYGRPRKPFVPSQGDQISQVSQAVPREDEASEKQGSYVGSSAIRAPSRAKSRNDFDAEELHKKDTTDEQKVVSPLWSKELTSVQPPSGPSQDAASGGDLSSKLSKIEKWQHASTPLKDMTTSSGEKRVEPPILPVEPEASGVQSTSPSFPETDTIDKAVIDDKVVKQSTTDERLSGPKQMQLSVADARYAPPTKGKSVDAPSIGDLEPVGSSEDQILDGEKAAPPSPAIIREDSHDAAMDEKTTTHDASSDQLIKGPLHEQARPPAATDEATELIDDHRTSKEPPLCGGSHAEPKSSLLDKKPAHAAQHLSPVELFRQETRLSAPILTGVPPSDSQSVTSQDDQVSHELQAVPHQKDMIYSQGTRHSQKSDIQHPSAKVHEVTRDVASEKQDSHMGSAFGYRVKSPNDFGTEESHEKDITDEQKVTSPLSSKEPISQVQPPPGPSQGAASGGDLSSKLSTIEQWQRASMPLKDMTTSSGEKRVEPSILPIEPEASGFQSSSPSLPEADRIDHAVVDKVVKLSTRDENLSRPKQMQSPITYVHPVPPIKGKTADAPLAGDLELIGSSEGQILDGEKVTPPGPATIREDSYDAAMDIKTTAYDAGSDQLVKGPLHEQAWPPAPTHEGTEPIDDHRASTDPQFRGGSQAEAIHAARKSNLSDKKPADDAQHPSPVEPVNIDSNDHAVDDTFVPQKIFRQETRPSTPIVRGVPPLDSQSATRKIQEVAPGYGRPGKAPVQSQGDQISHASQTIPRQEDAKYSRGTRDSQRSDIKGPSAPVHGVTRDELNAKQGVREATKAMHDPAIVHKDVRDANLLSSDVTKDTFKGMKAADSTPSSVMPIYTQKPALTHSMQAEVEEARDEGRQSSKAIPEQLKMVEREVGTSEGQLLDHRPSGQEAVDDVHGSTSDIIQPSDIRDTTKKSRVTFEITKTPGSTLSKVQPFGSQDVQPTNGEPITPTSGQRKDVSTKPQKNVQDVFQPSKLSGTSQSDSDSLSFEGKDAKVAETDVAEEKTSSTERFREMLKESESTMPKEHPNKSTMPKAHPSDSEGYTREKKTTSIHQTIPAGEKEDGSTLKHQQTSDAPYTLDEKFSASAQERADIRDDSKAEVSYRKDTSANQKAEPPPLSQKPTSQVHPSSEPYKDAVPRGDLSSKLSNTDQWQYASAQLKGANTDSDDTEINISSNIERKPMPVSQEGHLSSQHANQMAQQSGEQTVEPPEHAAPSLPEAATADHAAIDDKFVKQSIIDERRGEPKREDSHDAAIDEKTTTYDASGDQLVTGSLHEPARQPAPTHEATEIIGGQNEPQLGGSSQTEVEPARAAQMVFRQETRTSTPVTRGVPPLVSQSIRRKIQEVTPDNRRTDDSGKPLVPSQEDHILHASQAIPLEEDMKYLPSVRDSPKSDTQLPSAQVHEVTPDESSEEQGSRVGSALGQVESGFAEKKFTLSEESSSAEPSKEHLVIPNAKEIKALPTVISQQGTPETREVPTSKDAVDIVSTHGDVHSTTSTKPPGISFSVQEAEPTSSAEAPPFHVAHDTFDTGTTPDDALGNALPMKPSVSPGAQHGIAPENNAGEVTPTEHKFVPSGQDSVHSIRSPPPTVQRNEVIEDSAPKTQPISSTDQPKGIPTTLDQEEMSAPLRSVSPSSGTQRPSDKAGEDASDDSKEGVSKPPSHIQESSPPRVVSASAPIDEEVRDIQKFVPSGQDSVHSTQPPSYLKQRDGGIGNSAPSTQDTTKTPHSGEEQVPPGRDEGHATEPYRTTVDEKTTTSPSGKTYSSESGSDLTGAHTETSLLEHGLLTQPPLATLGAPNKANSAGQEAKAPIASTLETQPGSIQLQYEVAPVEQDSVLSEEPSSAEPSKEHPIVPTAKEIKALPTVIGQQGTPETSDVPTSKDAVDTVSTHGDVHSTTSTKPLGVSFSVQEAEPASSAEAPPFHVAHDIFDTGTTPDDALGNARPMRPSVSPGAQHGIAPGNNAGEVTPAEHTFVPSGQDSVHSKQSPPFTVQRNEVVGDSAPETQQISSTDQAKSIPTTLDQEEMSAPLRPVSPSSGTQRPSEKAGEDASDDLRGGVSKPPSHIREVRPPRVVPASAPAAIGEEVRDIQKFVPSDQDSVHSTQPPSYPEQRNGGIGNSAPSTQDTTKSPLPGEEQVPLGQDEGHATEPYRAAVAEKTTTSPSSKANSSKSGSDLTHAHTETSFPEHGLLTQPPLATHGAPNKAKSAAQEAKAPIASASETQPSSIQSQDEVAPIEQNFVVSDQESAHALKSPTTAEPKRGEAHTFGSAGQTNLPLAILGNQDTRKIPDAREALSKYQESSHDGDSISNLADPLVSQKEASHAEHASEGPTSEVRSGTVNEKTGPDSTLVTGDAYPTNADMLATNSLQNQQAQPPAATQAPTPQNPAASSQNVHADSLGNIETRRQPSKAPPASATISTAYSDNPNDEPGTAAFQTPQEAPLGGEKNTTTQGDQVNPVPKGDLSTSHAIRPTEGAGFKGTNSSWKLEGASTYEKSMAQHRTDHFDIPSSEDNNKEPQKQSPLLKETMESSGKSERKEQAGKAIVQSLDGDVKRIEQTETHDTKTDVPEEREPQKNTNRTNNKVSREETLDISGKQTSRVQMRGVISKDASDSIEDALDIKIRSNSKDNLRSYEESKVQQQYGSKSRGGETEAPRTDIVQQNGRDLPENSYQNNIIQSQAEGSDKSAEKFSSGIQNKNKTSSGLDSPTDGTKSGDAEDKSRQ